MKKEKCCHLLITQKHFISERTVLPDEQLHKLNIFSSLLLFQVSLSDPFIRILRHHSWSEAAALDENLDLDTQVTAEALTLNQY